MIGHDIGGARRRLAIFDLSQPLDNEVGEIHPIKHRIEYLDENATVEITRQVGIDESYWPDGKGYRTEVVHASTHSGTHIDAPYHYGPARSDGAGRTIDQIPLSWFIGAGVRLDLRHKKAGESITRSDVIDALDRADHRIRPHDVVLIWTGTADLYRTGDYPEAHPGLRLDATGFLLDQGVRLIGIDAWSIDRPFGVAIPEARAGDRAQLWESHLLGRDREYCLVENLCNLDAIPRGTGFTVVALPVKVSSASAAWARVVALMQPE
jgi:kynurenine formamidase